MGLPELLQYIAGLKLSFDQVVTLMALILLGMALFILIKRSK